MGNELTTSGLPHLSQSLQLLIGGPAASRYEAGPGDEAGFRIATPPPPRPSPEHQAEARRALTGYIALQAPSPRAIVHWLGDLNAVVANPVGGDMFEPKMRALGAFLSKYPASVFTVETHQDAVATFSFFPSGAELAAFFDKHLQVIRDVEARLRRIAAFEKSEPEPVYERPTPDVVAAVTAKLAAHRAELAANRAAREEAMAPEPPKPLPNVALTREQLLQEYDRLAAAGDRLAAVAASSLRRVIAEDNPPQSADGPNAEKAVEMADESWDA